MGRTNPPAQSWMKGSQPKFRTRRRCCAGQIRSSRDVSPGFPSSGPDLADDPGARRIADADDENPGVDVALVSVRPVPNIGVVALHGKTGVHSSPVETAVSHERKGALR